jgi:putative phosphoesterase
MRIAAIYDIHGNLPALEAVLGEIRGIGVDQIVGGGDVVPGPMPCECLARLLSLDVPVQFIQGNGERVVLAAIVGGDINEVPEPHREAIRWTGAQIRPEFEHVVARWPKTLRMPIPDVGDVLFCHATPHSDAEIFTRLTADERLSQLLEGVDVPVVVCGHTHMQFERTVANIRVVNAGSVGMPFGEPGAYWLSLGPAIQRRRTSYDLAQAAARIRATKYPGADDFAARNVLQPPSEEETLKAFSRVV